MINRQNKILVFLSLYYLIYLYSTIVQSNTWGNILSPIGAFIASFFIFKYIYQIPWSIIKIFGLSFSMGCLFYAVAELLWGLFDFTGVGDPEDSLIISLLYTVTNVLFFIAAMLYTTNKFKNWNIFQLIIDFLVCCSSVLYLLWTLFLSRDIQTLQIVIASGSISIINIILDILVFTLISIWYLSIRDGKISICIRLMATGIILYSVTDIIWYYLDLFDQYIPNTFIDSLYILSLLLISTAFVINDNPQLRNEFERYDYSNVGMNNKVFLLLVTLILLILMDGFIIGDLLFFSMLVLIYKSTSTYIQSAIRNEILLERETNLNMELERRIEARTKELTEKNQLLSNISNKNMLTNLYNRRYFNNKVKDMISKLSIDSNIVALFIDLNRFKAINDQYGHQTGDQVLIEVAKRLSKVHYNNSILCHFGGDEFVIACEVNRLNIDQIYTLAEKITSSFNHPIIMDKYSFTVSVSIGISIDYLGANIDDLINHADIAMYEAKKHGHNKFVFYDSILCEKIRWKNEIKYLLFTINFDHEFELYFQPQYNIVEHRIIGMEALLRWNNPKKGIVSPGEFIPIAEDVNHIIPIGKWVLINALKQISLWNNKYQLQLVIGINISPKQLVQDDFLLMIEQLFYDYQIDPKWIDFEITEGVAMIPNDNIFDILHKLKNMGVSISIDDFGTGYASFSSYRFFPFDRIKIPKQFIDNIHKDEEAYNITKFFLTLSNNLNNRLIVEGVESKEQYDVLTELGCEEIQGYYISKPLPTKEFEENFLQSLETEMATLD